MKGFRIFIIILLTGISRLSATNVWVGEGRAYKTLQSALMMANDGDTLFVDPGHYAEKNLIIKKSIALIGLGFPVLDGEHQFEIISIKANRVLIEGFKLVNSGISSIEDFAGIKIYNSRDVVIRNNILSNTFFGIYTQFGINCLIENNRMHAFQKKDQESGNGIHCWKSDSMRIIGNTIEGHRDGIYFEFVKNSIIWRNIAKNNLRYGLHFMFSNNDAYICNVFKENGAGVAVMFSNNLKMIHNFFEDNWGDGAYGLLLKEISDGYIENNQFRQNTTGIFMEGASRIEMKSNQFFENGWAVKMQASCLQVHVEKNNFIKNTFDVATNGSLVLNSFYKNYWDKYEGYDLNKDLLGDVPYRPVSLFSMLIEQNPSALILFRSLVSSLMDKAEKILPSLTPENLIDEFPVIKPFPL